MKSFTMMLAYTAATTNECSEKRWGELRSCNLQSRKKLDKFMAKKKLKIIEKPKKKTDPKFKEKTEQFNEWVKYRKVVQKEFKDCRTKVETKAEFRYCDAWSLAASVITVTTLLALH